MSALIKLSNQFSSKARGKGCFRNNSEDNRRSKFEENSSRSARNEAGRLIMVSTTATTKDGSTDWNGKPAMKRCTGGWKSAFLLLVNEGLATLAFFGVGVNLVLFLRRVMREGNAEAANSVSKWTGTVYIFSLAGAFLSDSYWGRYFTCAIFQLIFLLGLVLLSLSSRLILMKPSGCGDGDVECMPLSTLGIALFYISIYLIAFGNGGYQPSIATFGSDQFEEADPAEKESKTAFFSYFYLALNLGSLFSNTFLVYFEDSGRWSLGFWTATGSALVALLLFLGGSSRYRHFRPSGNPLVRITQVFVAAGRKWNVNVASPKLYELEGRVSVIAGCRKILHSKEFRFLDKAATVTEEEELQLQNPETDPWRLCTVTQVEEVKCVLKMLPIWLCTILYSVVFTQMASIFVEQGTAMNTTVANFHVPPASMSAFDILAVAAFVLLYRKLIAPLTSMLSGNPQGLTELQRMGTGLVIGMLAMIAAGVLELERLKRAIAGEKSSSLSILWQIPQYSLIGASEVFMYVGQLEFFNGQAPDGIKSFGSSLCMASISLGNYVSSLLVSVVMEFSRRGSSRGWIPEDLNSGHLDRFFFLLAGCTAVDFLVYLMCAKGYKYIALDNMEMEVTEKEDEVETLRRGYV